MHASEAHTSEAMRFHLHTKSAHDVADYALRMLDGWVENRVDGGVRDDEEEPGSGYRPNAWPDTWPALEEHEGHASVLVIPRRLYEDGPTSGAFADTLWAILEDLVEQVCPAGDDEAPCGAGEQAAARELMAKLGPAPEGRAPDSALYVMKEGKGEWSQPMDFDMLTGDMDFHSMDEVSALHRLNVGDVANLDDYYLVKRVK